MCFDAVAAFGQDPETDMIFIEAPADHRAKGLAEYVVRLFCCVWTPPSSEKLRAPKAHFSRASWF